MNNLSKGINRMLVILIIFLHIVLKFMSKLQKYKQQKPQIQISIIFKTGTKNLPQKKDLITWTGNPAWWCRLSFCSKIDQNFSKIKYGVNRAVKLDNFYGDVKTSEQRTFFESINVQFACILFKNSLLKGGVFLLRDKTPTGREEVVLI